MLLMFKVQCIPHAYTHGIHFSSVYTLVINFHQLKHSFPCKEHANCTHLMYHHHCSENVTLHTYV